MRKNWDSRFRGNDKFREEIPTVAPQPGDDRNGDDEHHLFICQIKWLSKKDVGVAGVKGANLGELLNAEFNVPEGFVLTTDAYSQFISENSLDGAALSNVKFIDFFLGTFFGSLITIFMLSFFFGKIADIILRGAWSQLFTLKFFLALGIFALSLLLPKMVNKAKKIFIKD